MSSSSQPVTSNTTTMTAPNSAVLPYSQFGLTEAARLYNNGNSNPLTTDAGNYLSTIINGGGGGPGGSQLFDTASGRYVGANPQLDAMYRAASRPVIDSIQSQFSRAGRYGSAANQDVLGRTLGELSSNIYGTDYARERQNQLSAANALTNRQTQALLFAPSFVAEQSGWGPLQRYLAAINGSGLGTSTTGTQTQPFFSNPLGEAAGALGSGALATSLLFGRNGVFPGALQSGARSAGDYLSGLFGGGGGLSLGDIQSGYDLGGYGAGFSAP